MTQYVDQYNRIWALLPDGRIYNRELGIGLIGDGKGLKEVPDGLKERVPIPKQILRQMKGKDNTHG